ncbi:hypothetical protein [Streptomyces sp. NPDC059970]|uniref:hypothetical protein n=2 Tax=unclassified Streptomyces TaxID=2593676 RepID=UPI0036B23715
MIWAVSSGAVRADPSDLAERMGLSARDTPSDADPDAPMRLVANPIGLPRTPPRYERRPPRLGEHTEDLRRWLDS